MSKITNITDKKNLPSPVEVLERVKQLYMPGGKLEGCKKVLVLSLIETDDITDVSIDSSLYNMTDIIGICEMAKYLTLADPVFVDA